ncbi:FHA domain-containing protein [Pseudoclavibacter sp. RFBB5]|uniref:FHA domain-containing protein n=1 Tax=Pseudoclavibacter sp. RFBB5 TaxID=2080574 RepID=UPI0021571DC9|nr:FHA domain-containing protein [Pseudoclavibacter sp. RFBB5]
MTEAPHEATAHAPVIFRQRRHALLIPRPLASSQRADPALDAGDAPDAPDAPEAAGAVDAARLAFTDGALSCDRVLAALLGGGPLSEVAPFVYLIRDGNGLRVLARGPLRVVELPNSPRVGMRPAVINAREALTWVEALLPAARGVEVTVEDDRLGRDEVPIQLLFADRDHEVAEASVPNLEAVETTADPDLDGTVGPGEAVQEHSQSLEAQLEGAPRSHTAKAESGEAFPEATILELPVDLELPSDDEGRSRDESAALDKPASESESEPAAEGDAPADGDAAAEGASEPEASEDADPSNRDAQTFPVPILDAEAQADLIGEHDGRTILSDEASRIRQAASARRAARRESQDHPDPAATQLGSLPPHHVASAGRSGHPELTDRPEQGEHDGLTVAGGSIQDLRRDRASQVGLGDLGETVLAQALSFETHPEGGGAAFAAPAAPPAGPVAAPAAEPAAPRLTAPSAPPAARPHAPAHPTAPNAPAYVVELSTGGTVGLAGPLVLGRAPSMGAEQTGGVEPQHVKLTGATDISRNHVLMSVEGGVIVVTDLHSRNGTDVVMPGRGPQRLRAGEPTAVMPNTVIDLGSGIFLTVRNLSMTASH